MVCDVKLACDTGLGTLGRRRNASFTLPPFPKRQPNEPEVWTPGQIDRIAKR